MLNIHLFIHIKCYVSLSHSWGVIWLVKLLNGYSTFQHSSPFIIKAQVPKLDLVDNNWMTCVELLHSSKVMSHCSFIKNYFSQWHSMVNHIINVLRIFLLTFIDIYARCDISQGLCWIVEFINVYPGLGHPSMISMT